MGQPIRGPIQRLFGLSCIRRVYFLRKSTEFYDLRAECQKIKNYHSFLSVLVANNDRQTHVTTRKNIYARRGTCTDALGRTCMEKHTHKITRKDAHRSTYTEIYNDSKGVYIEITGVHKSMCLYISTKGMGVHVGTPTGVSIVKMVVQGITSTYYEYRRYGPKQDIFMDALGKVRKRIRYADDL